jgi:hypothetical protein
MDATFSIPSLTDTALVDIVRGAGVEPLDGVAARRREGRLKGVVVQTTSADSYAGNLEREKSAWTSWSAWKSCSRAATSTVRSSCCAGGGISCSS